jgi:hypothetical protein
LYSLSGREFDSPRLHIKRKSGNGFKQKNLTSSLDQIFEFKDVCLCKRQRICICRFGTVEMCEATLPDSTSTENPENGFKRKKIHQVHLIRFLRLKTSVFAKDSGFAFAGLKRWRCAKQRSPTPHQPKIRNTDKRKKIRQVHLSGFFGLRLLSYKDGKLPLPFLNEMCEATLPDAT